MAGDKRCIWGVEGPEKQCDCVAGEKRISLEGGNGSGNRKRWFVLLGFVVAATLPVAAEKPKTVAQLEQALTAAYAAHMSDPEISHQIGTVKLSERLTETTLDRLESQLKDDPQSAQALQLLADKSAFLNLPAGELPTAPTPDGATQQRMLDAARVYVARKVPHIPNFIATRTTYQYDNRSYALSNGGWGIRSGLHLVGTSRAEVSVYDAKENLLLIGSPQVWRKETGLLSGGEFGSTLGMILADADKGKVIWSHWEGNAGGITAVFDYSVPKSASHFEIIETVSHGPKVSGGRPNTATAITKPGYHGSLWIDPETGAILRITMEADVAGNEVQHAAILVQYAPVRIGDSQFVCPVRSLALSDAIINSDLVSGDAATEWLNETIFTNYHRFGSTTRILSGNEKP